LTAYNKTDNIFTNYTNIKALMRKSNDIAEIKRGNAGGNFP
jgi:hypothetical protein